MIRRTCLSSTRPGTCWAASASSSSAGSAPAAWASSIKRSIRERNQVVALKTLRDVDAAALVRFKREFRALADISHPNLVDAVRARLRRRAALVHHGARRRAELSCAACAGDRRRGARRDAELRSPTDETVATRRDRRRQARAQSSDRERGAPSATQSSARWTRSMCRACAACCCSSPRASPRSTTRACCIAISSRPTSSSRTTGALKILDFGLVTEIASRAQRAASDRGWRAPSAYMSPEQGARLPLTPASDWYAVGVMLYEALTGRLPFVGALARYAHGEAAASSRRRRAQRVAGVPSDLDALCVELLRRDPEARPSRRATSCAGSAIDTRRCTRRRRAARVARRTALHRTRAPDERARRGASPPRARGRSSSRFVHGAVGHGQERRWCAASSTASRSATKRWCVAGRCYERESVPYKAVDSVIDALSQLSGAPRRGSRPRG